MRNDGNAEFGIRNVEWFGKSEKQIFRVKEGEFWTGATVGGLLGVTLGAGIGTMIFQNSGHGFLDPPQDWSMMLGAIVCGAGGVLIGGLITEGRTDEFNLAGRQSSARIMIFRMVWGQER